MSEKLLEIKKLQTKFSSRFGQVMAVRGIDFAVEKGDCIGIVGESGSGKTVTALSVMRLIEKPGMIAGGEILYRGEDLLKKSEKEMGKVRGKKIAMVFQDPTTSFNPAYTMGNQLIETIKRNMGVSRRDATGLAKEVLYSVGLPEPEKRMKQYPHELSTGMRQRVAVAMALSGEPDLLIADEPTSALDVTIQAKILKLFEKIKMEKELSMIIITHDLGVAAEACNKILIMYGGLIMESGSARDVLTNPMHPYTKGLLGSVPGINSNPSGRLNTIEGSPPDLIKPGPGCPFSERCPHAMKICGLKIPEFHKTENAGLSMCWLLDEKAPRHSLEEFLGGDRA